jgi:uncharacterized protein
MRTRFAQAIALLVLLQVPGAWALTYPDKPPREHFYVDGAHLLSVDDARAIDDISRKLLIEQRVPIFTVTIQSLASMNAADYTVERYAAALFNHWGIGSPERNYGMLLLVSRDDRRARIELGAAWGTRYDVQAQEVMSTLIIPAFKRGDFGAGLVEGIRGLDALARGLNLPAPKRPAWLLPAVIGVVLLCIGVIMSLFMSGRTGWGWALLIMLGALLFFLFRAVQATGGSGGGFGGGSSGGGGASGSW